MAEDRDVIQDIKRRSTKEVVELFLTLEAPTMEEMDGEFESALLKQPSLLAEISSMGFSNLVWPGTWLGKGFRPIEETEGRGYNVFSYQGKIVQRFAMQTLIAPSRFDSKPSYQLVYRAYHSVPAMIHMVDEVRRLEPGVYIGIGTYGFIEAQRRIPYPFLLQGPAEPYRGDIGHKRKGFKLESELNWIAS